MGIEEERIKIRKIIEKDKKRKRVDWLKSRFRKWTNILLCWFGVLFLLIMFRHFLFPESDMATCIAAWLGMFLNDMTYQLGIVRPYDRKKLIIDFKEDREHR